ncbi:MAG: phosphatidylglycerol lysyltransferase domain-containing protein [Verrucomicrobiaceae bacterium]|nr:phosphatidylglycerol lysyltransferase domain-containing protein [Verrucomicrobiaceae bacterium]
MSPARPITRLIFIPMVLRLALILLPCGLAGAQDQPEEGVIERQVRLARGDFSFRIHPSRLEEPRAVFVFGSGDGGWSEWEEVVTGWLNDAGVIVVAFDLRQYCKTDFTFEMLGRDAALLAAEGVKEAKNPAVPVLYGGWSTGAVDAVAAAAWQGRPGNLAGLLLMAADSRGRYGLKPSDELGITPTGTGTFALGEFSRQMTDLRVAQFHGTTDFMASTTWIRSLKSPHALYEVPGANHGFDGPVEDFQDYLLRGLDWVLGDDDAAAPPEDVGLPFGLSPLWPVAVVAVSLTLFFIFSRRHSLRVLTWAVIVMGCVDLLEAVVLKPPGVIAWMEQWIPIGVSEKSRILLLISGVSQLVLARALRRRKRMGWFLTVVLLSASVVLHLSRAFDWHHALAALVLLVPLVRWRKEFVARSDRPSISVAWKTGVVLLAALFIYGTVSLHEFSVRGAYGGDGLTWGECAQAAVAGVFAQKSGVDHQGSREARNFLRTLRIGGLCTGLIVLAMLLRRVVDHEDAATGGERQRARRLIAAHGTDPMDCFALLPDKRYFFSDDGEGVIAYALWRNFAVALADPICADGRHQELIASFIQFCVRQDWEPVFYCSHVDHRAQYESQGLATLKVGEDARLDAGEFKLAGGRFQNLRTARNKAQKNGLSFQWYDALPQPDHGLEAELRHLSDQWLKRKHGGEMTFDLGCFDIAAIREHGVSIARNLDGHMEAFATWCPYAQGKGRCLDMMRAREEARDVMDFLIVEAIDWFKARGVVEISLGNAPLANIDAETGARDPTRQERAVKFLFENFDRFYGYKSLFNFKKKYRPEWQGRYLAYRPGVSLALIGLAIAGVHLPRGFAGLLRS